MVYISTDYVFDGNNPPYGESDETNPLNFYGKSKLDGEKVVLETSTSKVLSYHFLHLGQIKFFMFVIYGATTLGIKGYM